MVISLSHIILKTSTRNYLIYINKDTNDTIVKLHLPTTHHGLRKKDVDNSISILKRKERNYMT